MGLDTFFTPRLTELGKLKIGHKGAEITSRAGNKFRPPQKDDFFTITTLQRNGAGDLLPDEALMKQIAPKYASADGKLRQLPIRLLSDDPEEIMQSAYVWYGGKTIGARSNGKRVTWFNDPKTGKKLDAPKEEDWKDEFLDYTAPGNTTVKLFKLHTTFNCVVAAPEAKWGGVYKFRTTSKISGEQLYGSLIETKRLTGGVLVGMPLVLVVRPMQVAPEGKATTVYVVHVELHDAEMKAIQEQALTQMKYAVEFKGQMLASQAQYRKMLVAPGEMESDAEAKDITEEFHPEAEGSAEARPAPPTQPDPLLQQATAAETVDTTTGEIRDAEIVEPEPPPPTSAVSPLVGEPVLSNLKGAFRAQNFTRGAVAKILLQYEVKALDELTLAHAEELLAKYDPPDPPPSPDNLPDEPETPESIKAEVEGMLPDTALTIKKFDAACAKAGIPKSAEWRTATPEQIKALCVECRAIVEAGI